MINAFVFLSILIFLQIVSINSQDGQGGDIAYGGNEGNENGCDKCCIPNLPSSSIAENIWGTIVGIVALISIV
jgi:hypothetical protein